MGSSVGEEVKGVIDTGATGVFLGEHLARRLNLKTRKRNTLVQLVEKGNILNAIQVGKVRIGKDIYDAIIGDWHHELILGLPWVRNNKSDCINKMQLLNHEVLHIPKQSDCNVCSFSNLRRKRMIRRDDRWTAKSFNEVVSIDLVVPNHTGIDGTKYLMSHLDEFTGWVKLECLKGKNSSDVLRGMEEAQRGRGWPRVVKTDGGTEFQGAVEDALRKNLVAKTEGIAHRPNTHGIERMHADLNSGVRALLVQAGLGTEWYPLAAKYWAMARNLHFYGKNGNAFVRRDLG